MSDEPLEGSRSSARVSPPVEPWEPERRDRDARLLLLLLAAAFILGFVMAALLFDSRRPAGPDPQARTGPPRGEEPLPPPAESCVPRDDCCRVCVRSKACGNSCIRRAFQCHQPDGCACDADEVCS